MEPAVATVLAEVLSQPTAWDDLKAWRTLPGFQANRKTAPQAGGVPQSRRNLWLTQAPGVAIQNAVQWPHPSSQPCGLARGHPASSGSC